MTDYCKRAVPTFGSSFVGSVAFTYHLLEMEGSDGFFSTRLTGAAKGLYLEKRKLVQKPALSVSQVKALEKIVVVVEKGTPSSFPRIGMRQGASCTVCAMPRFSDVPSSGDIFKDVHETKDGLVGFLDARVII